MSDAIRRIYRGGDFPKLNNCLAAIDVDVAPDGSQTLTSATITSHGTFVQATYTIADGWRLIPLVPGLDLTIPDDEQEAIDAILRHLWTRMGDGRTLGLGWGP
jgi:hypothetical protein